MAHALLITKSHVSAFTRKDGAFVAAHDDKRVAVVDGKISADKLNHPDAPAGTVKNPLYHQDGADFIKPREGNQFSRHDFERKPVTDVDTSGIISAQVGVNPKKVNRISSEYDEKELDPVHLIKLPDGRHVIANGNHRVVASMMAGNKKIKAHVMDHSDFPEK